MITEAQAIAVVRKRMSQGEVSNIMSDGSILVKIGKSFTKIRPNEVHSTLIQLSQPPKEDLMAIAIERNQAEREANGISLAERKTLTKSESDTAERSRIAEKYNL